MAKKIVKPELDEFQRTTLVMDILRACNLRDEMWKAKSRAVDLAELLRVITDPRIQDRLLIRKAAVLVSTLRKHPEIWEKAKLYLKPEYSFSENCANCKHKLYNHGIYSASYEKNSACQNCPCKKGVRKPAW